MVFCKDSTYALGPLGAGIILDVLDLATFGPIGIIAGALVGGYAGWVLGEFEGFDRNIRIAFAICTAAYMTIPFTEPIPAATILFLTARFFACPSARAVSQQSTDSTDEATYCSVDDDGGQVDEQTLPSNRILS